MAVSLASVVVAETEPVAVVTVVAVVGVAVGTALRGGGGGEMSTWVADTGGSSPTVVSRKST